MIENNDYEFEVSVILPCRNEQSSLGYCIKQICQVFAATGIKGEIIVSDSSTDSSPDIALKYGAVLIKHDKVGYGRAYLEGFRIAKGRYLFLADADGTYDFREIPAFISELSRGYDLILGDRFAHPPISGSMPWMRRHVGNPLLSGLLRLLFSVSVNDSHSGMRALRHETANILDLQSEGMEFASEMIIKAARSGMKIKELPIEYHPRRGLSKLRPLVDGLRHLKLMLECYLKLHASDRTD